MQEKLEKVFFLKKTGKWKKDVCIQDFFHSLNSSCFVPSGVQINSDGKKIGKRMWVNAGKKLQAVGSFAKEIFLIKMQSKIDTYHTA